MNGTRSTLIAINELNMARHQCIRLITVDETTVSSSRSSSSSRVFFLHCSTCISVASVHRTSFVFLHPSARLLTLVASCSLCILNILFSLLDFFSPSDLVSLHSSRSKHACLPFLFEAALFGSSSSFCILVVFSIRLPSLLPSTPYFSVVLYFFLFYYYTWAIREYCRARVSAQRSAS